MLASRSTSHHELSALPEMVLNLKDFAAKQIKLVKCTLAHAITTLFTRQSSHCSDLYDTTRSSPSSVRLMQSVVPTKLQFSNEDHSCA